MRYRKALRIIYLAARGILLAPFAGKSKNVNRPLNSYRKIMVLSMDRLGDLMCSLPAMRALREAVPQAELTVCSPPYLKDLLNDQPWIDHWCSPDDVTGLPADTFDLAVDLSTDYPLRKAILSRRAKINIGFNIAGRGAFFSNSLPDVREKIHTVDQLANLLSLLGIKNIDRQPRLVIAPKWRRELTDVLKKHDVDSSQFAAIHPGGTYETQRWPQDRFAQIADRLNKKMAAPALLLGGPAENSLCRQISATMESEPLNLCGELSMGGLAAAIAASKILICNNSGPLHIGVAVDTPTVSTMGPTLPQAWWPIGAHHRVIRRDLPCSPCNEGYCKIKTRECLLSISVDEMWDEIELLLRN